MPSTFRLHLKPQGSFYFGGEQPPGQDDYYLRSRPFPQQTAVLGMIRYQMLKAAGYLSAQPGQGLRLEVEREAAAAALIGPESFDGAATPDLGQIEKLSPVFLSIGKEVYFLTRALQDMSLHSLPGKVATPYGEPRSQLHYLQGFDSKSAYPQEVFLNQRGEALPVWKSDDAPSADWAFGHDTRIGITKQYRHQPKEDGFYKIEMVRMHPKASFTCDLKLKAPVAGFEDGARHLVFLGGNRTPFTLTVEAREDFFPEAERWPRQPYWQLLSDAWLPSNPAPYCQLALTDTIRFRNLKNQTTADNPHHQKPSDATAHPARLMLKRGSCLYPQDPQRLEELFHQTSFHTIGYNYFLPSSTNA